MRCSFLLISVLLFAVAPAAGKKDKVVKVDDSGSISITNSPGTKVTNEVTVNGKTVYRKTCVDGKCTESTTKK